MAEQKPHVVLLDLVRPGSDGIALMADILKTADVPVIFLSVYGQDEIVARALDVGAARLSDKALLSDGTGCQDPDRPSKAVGSLPGRALGTLQHRTPEHRLPPPPGDREWEAGEIDRY